MANGLCIWALGCRLGSSACLRWTRRSGDKFLSEEIGHDGLEFALRIGVKSGFSGEITSMLVVGQSLAPNIVLINDLKKQDATDVYVYSSSRL